MEEGSTAGFVPAVPHIHVTHEVIGEIAVQTALQIEGVSDLGGNLATGLSDMLGRHPATRGVRVDVTGRDVDLSVHVIVHYRVRIPEVAQKVQEQVKMQVERATGLRVRRVDIHIQGVTFRAPDESVAATDET